METPFVFGKLATGVDFTDRAGELLHLKQNFLSGINTILISPRRWGKSSLVSKAVKEVSRKEKGIRIVSLDLFNVRTEEDFYRIFSEEVIRSTVSGYKEILWVTKNFFRNWIPKVSFSPDHLHEFSLGLDWKGIRKEPDEVLDLPQRIAESKGWHLIICIDEFQNIGFFADALAFQKQLRSHWQKHSHVSYCLYGSKRHMMIDVFTSPTMPFYNFGDLIFLDKIEAGHWEKFIVSRFRTTGKVITAGQARKIALLAECHPYYVQQLAQACWLRSSEVITDQVIDQSMESLILQMSLLFQNLVESLPTTQINFLRAVVNQETRLSSKEILLKYSLTTSANVSRIRQGLIDKELIDTVSGEIQILDPLFRAWMKRYYFL
jgi:hypothetical protein